MNDAVFSHNSSGGHLVGAAVPFRDYSGFNDEILQAMTAAYDAALAKLGIEPGDPMTSNLAAMIAALASEGEHDRDKLCEQAVAGIKAKEKTKRK